MHPDVLTREQVREVDRRAVEELGMSSLVLMENAGRGCVDVLQRLGISGRVVVCCGKGNNGGDGFVIARHLELRGFATRVVLCCNADGLSGDALANYRILVKSDADIVQYGDEFNEPLLNETLDDADWIVDALLGTGAKGAPRAPYGEIISVLNERPAKKLAVDVPSGLDCDTGRPASVAFRADHTCTFVASKPGFLIDEAKPFLGQLHVLDIGVPTKLLRSM
ncbi:MAG: NAD(P)H-hydrate epimerase [Planctomycetes bacterium]|nr:NAD(P)H-hydrate epimerase [Planctomycetota bacterium]